MSAAIVTFNNLRGWPLVLVAAAILGWVVWRLYLDKDARSNGGVRRLLPWIRMSAVFVLIVSLLKPVLLRPQTEAEKGAVVVLVDRSASMGMTDEFRSPSQRIALAEALHVITERSHPEIIESLSKSADASIRLMSECTRASRELDYALISGRPTEPARARMDEIKTRIADLHRAMLQQIPGDATYQPLRAAAVLLNAVGEYPRTTTWLAEARARLSFVVAQLSALQQTTDEELYHADEDVRAAADSAAELTRLEIASRFVFDESAGILPRLGSRVPVVAFAFDHRLYPVATRSAGSTIGRLEAIPVGLRTNLPQAIASVREQMGRQTVRAILVFSDGRQSLGEPSAPLAIDVPVYLVPVAPAGAVRDISITPDQLPRFVRPEQDIVIRGIVRSFGFRGKTVRVVCKLGGNSLEKEIALTDDPETPVEFRFRVKSRDSSNVEMEIPLQTGEATAENNRWLRHLKWVNDSNPTRPEFPYALVQNGIALDVDRLDAEPGEEFHIRARVADGRVRSNRPMSVALYRNGVRVGQEALTREGEPSAGRFTAALRLREPGEYSVVLMDDATEIRDMELHLWVAQSNENELANVTCDDRTLRRLADGTDGDVIVPEKLLSSVEQILLRSDDQRPLIERTLWDSAWLFGFVIACLSLEWSLRKQCGLV